MYFFSKENSFFSKKNFFIVLQSVLILFIMGIIAISVFLTKSNYPYFGLINLLKIQYGLSILKTISFIFLILLIGLIFFSNKETILVSWSNFFVVLQIIILMVLIFGVIPSFSLYNSFCCYSQMVFFAIEHTPDLLYNPQDYINVLMNNGSDRIVGEEAQKMLNGNMASIVHDSQKNVTTGCMDLESFKETLKKVLPSPNPDDSAWKQAKKKLGNRVLGAVIDHGVDSVKEKMGYPDTFCQSFKWSWGESNGGVDGK